jgi:ribosome-interacting GTPase 1
LDEEDIGTTYTQTIVLMNKCDAEGAEERKQIFREFVELDLDTLEVSGASLQGLDTLAAEVFRRLDVVRVYSKNPKAKEPDMTKPFVVKKGQTLMEVADQIHRDLATTLRSARIWGTGVHPGTTVKPDYQPHDKDIVELHSAAQ